MGNLVTETLCFFAAVVYPTHASLKAIQSGSREDSLQWLAYWVLHALLTSAEELFDAALAWCACVRPAGRASRAHARVCVRTHTGVPRPLAQRRRRSPASPQTASARVPLYDELKLLFLLWAVAPQFKVRRSRLLARPRAALTKFGRAAVLRLFSRGQRTCLSAMCCRCSRNTTCRRARPRAAREPQMSRQRWTRRPPFFARWKPRSGLLDRPSGRWLSRTRWLS